MENRAEENRKNSSTGTGEEHNSDRNRMYLEKLHTETIDREGRDVEDVLGSIVLEWARRSGLGRDAEDFEGPDCLPELFVYAEAKIEYRKTSLIQSGGGT